MKSISPFLYKFKKTENKQSSKLNFNVLKGKYAKSSSRWGSITFGFNGHGRPLILVAGMAWNISLWQPILEQLKTHFQLLIFDNRGVGRSDCPDQAFTIEDMALDTLMLIEKVDCRNRIF